MTRTIINIGRQFGSGGKSVAEVLGKKLGIEVYDNEILIKAAEESGFSQDLFKRNDENRSILTLGGIFGSNRYGTFTSNVLSDQELFKIQSDVIRDIAEKGNAIFVGRASDYVLRDLECLDVFICAPMENRKARVAQRLNVSEEEAEKIIQKRDYGRKKFYDFFTFGEWGVASNYDLCIDSSLLGIEGTAEYILEFGKKSGLIG